MEQVPPGFRFYPTEEELISFYLHNKLHAQKPGVDRVIPSLDIYSFEPSQLPEQAGELCHKETEQWFFFVAQQEREARGGRPNRTTATGYWKATGSPSYVYSCNKIIGSKKTMVFYKGKAPSGRKTKWKMNEYKAININQEINISNTSAPSCNSTIPMAVRNELCLCRVYITSGCARAFDRRPPPPPAPTMTTLNNDISTLQHNDNTNYNNSNDVNIHSTCDYNMRLEIVQGSGTTSIDRCTQNATINNNNNNNNNNNIMLLDEKSSSIDDSYNSAGEDGATTQENNIIYDDIDIGIDIEMGETLDTSIDWEGLGCL